MFLFFYALHSPLQFFFNTLDGYTLNFNSF